MSLTWFAFEFKFSVLNKEFQINKPCSKEVYIYVIFVLIYQFIEFLKTHQFEHCIRKFNDHKVRECKH